MGVRCEHYGICGFEINDAEEGLCILHSENPTKNLTDFNKALNEHRKKVKGGDCFRSFIFPADGANFFRDIFTEANFFNAKFLGEADFMQATFDGPANFIGTEFKGSALFYYSTFNGEANFLDAKFKQANFKNATFQKGAVFFVASFEKVTFETARFLEIADFYNATFETADFSLARFNEGSDFGAAIFTREAVFSRAWFCGRNVFASGRELERLQPIFLGAEIDFRQAIIDPLDALILRDADLRKCRFQGMDLRKLEITNANWPVRDKSLPLTCSQLSMVYDERLLLQNDKTVSHDDVEQLYRQLKQNYEERRDFERARDFHYGEKEMRRLNPKTPWGLKKLLGAYRLAAGYGDSASRLLLSTVVVLVLFAFLYLLFGVCPKNGPELAWTKPQDWPQALLYSLRVMTLLKPEELQAASDTKTIHTLIYTLQSIAGPILIGLFGLALRQRLKR
jgi:uncharacterized protein YjbI with pentapeptide repeats